MKKIDIINKLYTFTEWVMFLAWLNILWILFTLLGGIVFGWAPATAATISMVNRSIEEETTRLPVFKQFFSEYKKYLLKGNYIGYTILTLSIFLGYGVLTLPYLPTVAFLLLSVFYGAVVSTFIVTSLYAFPELVRNNGSYRMIFKNALFMSISHLNHSLVIIGVLGLIYLVFMGFPGAMIFMLFSLPLSFIARVTRKSYERIETLKKREELRSEH